ELHIPLFHSTQKQDRALFWFASGVAAVPYVPHLLEAENASTVPNPEYVAKCLYTAAVSGFQVLSICTSSFGSRKCFNCSQSRICRKVFIYWRWAARGQHGPWRGGGAPFDVGFFTGNENADPADMGTTEQHQNIARREWDELRSSREWISVENHFARYDRKIDAIFEKARSMYRDGHLALDIEDESDIKRGLDAYFSDLHDFPSNGHRFRQLKLVAGCLGNARSRIWAEIKRLIEL
nr:hypothetical protein [Tanacetum cinerariifolium]